MEIWAWDNGFLGVEVSFNRRGKNRREVAASGSGKMLRKGMAGRIERAGHREAQGQRGHQKHLSLSMSVRFSFLVDLSFNIFFPQFSLSF